MKNRKKGFTLVEVIVAIALMGIIAVGIIPAFAAQFKMTIASRELTSQSFDAQGEFERVIQELKDALVNDSLRTNPIDGVTETDFVNIFGRNVKMQKLSKSFPFNENKDFLVFISPKLAQMEVRQLLVAKGVRIEVSNETIHKVANLQKTPKPELFGIFDTNTDPNWYANLYKWYVSREGSPDPQFPDDYERIVFSGNPPKDLSNLERFSNRFILFSVTPVDIHGTRGNEAFSANSIYVLGKEWRPGSLIWVDKDSNASYSAATDVVIPKAMLEGEFDGGVKFIGVDVEYDPRGGSLYVPMSIDRVPGQPVGPPIMAEGSNPINWKADKSIHLAADVSAENGKDIRLKARDGDITLYQYVKIKEGTEDAEFDANGMPVTIHDGPEIYAKNGSILLETGKRGVVTIQDYSSLKAGKDITIKPFGNINLYRSEAEAGASILLDSTKGITYPGNRDINIQNSLIKLSGGGTAGRSIEISSGDDLNITGTQLIGNTGTSSSIILNADQINLSNTQFSNAVVQLEDKTSMIGGGWNSSTVRVKEGTVLTFAEGGSKVNNTGGLILGNTGGVAFRNNMERDLSNPLRIDLSQVDSETVRISTNYGRNVDYADPRDYEYIGIPGDYNNLGSGSTNLKYTVTKRAGTGSPSLSYAFDGTDTISIRASGIEEKGYASSYELTVADRYANGVIGKILFYVYAGENEPPILEVQGTTSLKRVVVFDGNGGTVSEISREVELGDSLGTLPKAPTRAGYDFKGWKTASSTDFDETTPVTANITVYAQWAKKTSPQVNVIFRYNHIGMGTYATKQVYLGSTMAIDEVALPDNPKRSGYIFSGWNTNANGGANTVFTRDTVINNSPTNVYAQWEVQTKFSDISVGSYFDIDGTLFPKISDTSLLARNRIPKGSVNIMDWSTANDLSANYYKAYFKNWITDSGLLSGESISSLDRQSILQTGYTWWGGVRSTSWGYVSSVYTVSDQGSRGNTSILSAAYSCRPYITVNNGNLYVSGGLGTVEAPYMLTWEN